MALTSTNMKSGLASTKTKMKDIETELDLDKSILAAQFSLKSMRQRFKEAEQPLPFGLLTQIINLQDSLEQAIESRHPNLDWDVRVGLTSNGIQEVLDEAQKEERTLLSVLEALIRGSKKPNSYK
jgi:hypothetical protein